LHQVIDRREAVMHIELNQDEALALRELLQEKVRQMDMEINRADSLRYKGELRQIEHKLEHILGSVSTAIDRGPGEWEARDAVSDEEAR
jgi:hypothetical protein